MLRFVARNEGQERRFPIAADGVWTVGSAIECELSVPFDGVSRRHASLERRGSRVWLTDCGSKNGLRVEGRVEAQIELLPGIRVDLGGTVVEIEEAASSDTRFAVELRRSSSVASRLRTSTAGAMAGDGRSSPAAALAFVRRFERASLQPGSELWSRLVAETLEILEAETVAVLQRVPGEPREVLEQCWGRHRVPGAEVEDPWSAAQLSAELEGESARIVAILGQGAKVDRWKEDFFSYLATRWQEQRHDPPAPRAQPAQVEPERGPVVLGRSAAMVEVETLARAAAESGLNVVLLGETGTGKEVLSRFIHRLRATGKGELVAINCAAIPSELLEAELFGVASRVATGVDPREGLFVRAHGGTLLLDEIGEMPYTLQAKLLRALQEREVMPVGGRRPMPVDLRVISTTHRPLARLVAEKKFRADLYYRLRGLEIWLPPLRERLEDIPEFATLFAQRAARASGKRVRGITERALRLLTCHRWPGNVRELETDMERAVALCADGGSIDSRLFSHLDPVAGRPSSVSVLEAPTSRAVAPKAGHSTVTLREELDATERERIRRELALSGGNKSEAARRLGVTWNGLVMKMKRLGLR